MKTITLRFVTSDHPISILIRTQAGICMPFTPSHVEALSRDGKDYIGAHMDGGTMARPIGYDTGAKGLKEKFVDLPVTDEQYEQFHEFLDHHIGTPYDTKAILSFAAPDVNLHLKMAAICSALQTLALRACNYFPMPLTVPAHHVSPRDLLLILSTHVQIDHEEDHRG